MSKEYNNFTVCYGAGKALGLNLIDYKPKKLQWFRFEKDNKITMIKFVEKKETEKKETTIKYVNDFEKVDELIIVLNNQPIDDFPFACKIYKINLSKIKESGQSIKYSNENDYYFFSYPKKSLKKPIISEAPLDIKISKIDIKTVSRYESIMERNCLQRLNYLLFLIYSTSEEEVSNNIFDVKYELPPSTEENYQNMYSDMTQIRKRNDYFKTLYDETKKEPTGTLAPKVTEFKKDYYKCYKKNILTFEQFSKFWNQEADRTCEYCGISESQIALLDKKCQIKTKRFYSRGKTMEVDKVDAFGEYEVENIILSCYWCNNAKTDEYDLKEFKSIANGINKVWNQRLNLLKIEKTAEFPSLTYKKPISNKKKTNRCS